MSLWLCANASAQIFVACLLGWVMLLPMQPWGKRLKETLPTMRAMLSAHLDFILLALTQLLVAFVATRVELSHPRVIFGLLVFGGWVNPLPYLFRGKGVDAFVMAGGARQRLASALSGTSSAALTVAWGLVTMELVRACLRAQGT